MRKLEDWIDYIEDAMPEKRKEKLDLLLRFSADDQMVVDNLTRLRRIVKYSDPAQEISVELLSRRGLGEIHDKVMAKIKAQSKRQRSDLDSPEKTSGQRQDEGSSATISNSLEID